MGKQSTRKRKKSGDVSAEAGRSGGNGGFQEDGGWARAMRLDHQDKMIVALIFITGLCKIFMNYFYPAEDAEGSGDSKNKDGLLGVLGF